MDINGKIIESQEIRFHDVPVITPNGETLIEKLNFEIKPGMNVLISGPNVISYFYFLKNIKSNL